MFKVGQVVMQTKRYPKGMRASRLVGVIVNVEKRETGFYCVLHPLPTEAMKLELRERFCEVDGFVHQGAQYCYSDTYGFACTHLSPEDTIICGELPKPTPSTHWTPHPGDTGYSNM
jgi:hypothetical protein